MTPAANTFHNYIGGKWQDAQGGQTFPNYNPATGNTIVFKPASDTPIVH